MHRPADGRPPRSSRTVIALTTSQITALLTRAPTERDKEEQPDTGHWRRCGRIRIPPARWKCFARFRSARPLIGPAGSAVHRRRWCQRVPCRVLPCQTTDPSMSNIRNCETSVGNGRPRNRSADSTAPTGAITVGAIVVVQETTMLSITYRSCRRRARKTSSIARFRHRGHHSRRMRRGAGRVASSSGWHFSATSHVARCADNARVRRRAAPDRRSHATSWDRGLLLTRIASTIPMDILISARWSSAHSSNGPLNDFARSATFRARPCDAATGSRFDAIEIWRRRVTPIDVKYGGSRASWRSHGLVSRLQSGYSSRRSPD